MRILVNVGHPKHVNILKNVIKQLERKGHEVKFISSNKENTLRKLDSYGFNYEYYDHYNGLAMKAIGMILNDIRCYKTAKNFKPDIFLGWIPSYLGHVKVLIKKPYIAFTDVEGDSAMSLMKPFADVIMIPSCFKKDLGPKEVRINSYFELAYLHPNNFKADPSFLKALGLTTNDRYILVKISSLNASHDIGAKGLNFRSSEELINFIKKLEPYGRVFLESEIKLGDEFDKYILRIPINDFHNCIFYSAMYIGDGASIAAEAGVLGVPSIYVTNNRKWGFLEDLEKNYGLVYTFGNRNEALEKAIELLNEKNLKEDWKKKREKMLREKIDPVGFMVKLIDDYEINKC